MFLFIGCNTKLYAIPKSHNKARAPLTATTSRRVALYVLNFLRRTTENRVFAEKLVGLSFM